MKWFPLVIVASIGFLSLSSVSASPVPAKAFAGTSSFVILDDGSLWGWGPNHNGNIVNTTLREYHTPIPVGKGADWAMVANGTNFTIALRTDGTLWSWGSNQFGQLGRGLGASGQSNQVGAAQIGEKTDWVTVSTSYFHVVALDADGSLWIWGANSDGRLGLGDTIHRDVPVKLGTDKWRAAVASMLHTIAIRDDGTLWTWGNNEDGRLGLGDIDEYDTPTQIVGFDDWVAISSSGGHTLGQRSDGSLWGWGWNFVGQLGQGDFQPPSPSTQYTSPVQIGADKNWAQFSAGRDFSIAIDADGALWGWGMNIYGQVGASTPPHCLTPLRIGSDSDWASVDCGTIYSLAFRNDGTLWGWGANAEAVATANGEPSIKQLTPFPIFIDTDVEDPSNNGNGNTGNGTNKPAKVRPDVAIGKKASQLKGLRTYAPQKQKITLVSKKAKRVTGHLRLANQDQLADVLVVRGGKGNKFFKVAWLEGKKNVTGKVTKGKYNTTTLTSASKPVALKVTITPQKKQLQKKVGTRTRILKKQIQLPIRVHAKSQASEFDTATFVVKTQPAWLK